MRKLTFLNLEPENFSLEAKKKLKKTTKYVERKLNQKELLKEIHLHTHLTVDLGSSQSSDYHNLDHSFPLLYICDR